MQVVVLASGSQYRAQLLSRLGVHFTTVSPDIDESAVFAEPPRVLAERLAKGKAEAAAMILDTTDVRLSRQPSCADSQIIIASDQVACNGNLILGKPGTRANARAQLARMSGERIEFLTSLHMLDRKTGRIFTALDVTHVSVRHLDEDSIARYVAAESPLDCAGSFKVEALGISLFDSVASDDPTALIGLPLIKVCEGLRYFGLQIP